ncbi:MAG: tetratricopeptide repeat protein [Treponema sp.]|jgi:tetratricopeptide (TPR) repeat protein|nr:tetratricopeptide repeat protein [Treponema sp.]
MDADFYVMRGDDRKEKGEYKSAIEDYTQAIGLKQDYAEAYYKRAYAYLSIRDNDNVIKDFSQVIDLKPDDRNIMLGAYHGRGAMYLSTHEYESAIEDFTKVIDDAEKFEKTRSFLAARAGDAISVGINYKTTGRRAYLERSDAYRSMGDFENAFKDMEGASQAGDDSDENFRKGTIYYKNDDYDSAIEAFQRSGCSCKDEAVKLTKSKAVSGHIKSGNEYQNKGDYKNAADKYKKALGFSDPDNDRGKISASASIVRGNIHYKNGDYKKAFEQYKNALEFDPVNETLKTLKQKYLESGNAYFQKGDYENAVKDYGKAFRYDLDNADAKNNLIASYNSLGGACFAKQDYNGAIAEYKKALALDPDNESVKRGMEKAEAEKARFCAEQNEALKKAMARKTALSFLIGILAGAIAGAAIGAIAVSIIGKFADAGGNVWWNNRIIGAGIVAAAGAIIGMISGTSGNAGTGWALGVIPGGLVAVGVLVYSFGAGYVKGVGTFIAYLIASALVGLVFGLIIGVIGAISGAIAGAVVKKEKQVIKAMLTSPTVGAMSVNTPVAGTVLKNLLSEGAHVNSGDTIIIIESMKMELEIKAASSGAVHYLNAPGNKIAAGEPIATIL